MYVSNDRDRVFELEQVGFFLYRFMLRRGLSVTYSACSRYRLVFDDSSLLIFSLLCPYALLMLSSQVKTFYLELFPSLLFGNKNSSLNGSAGGGSKSVTTRSGTVSILIS